MPAPVKLRLLIVKSAPRVVLKLVALSAVINTLVVVVGSSRVSIPDGPLTQLVALAGLVSVFQLPFCAPLQYAELASTTEETTSCSAVAVFCSEKVRPPPIAKVLAPPANLKDPVKTEPLLKVIKS